MELAAFCPYDLWLTKQNTLKGKGCNESIFKILNYILMKLAISAIWFLKSFNRYSMARWKRTCFALVVFKLSFWTWDSSGKYSPRALLGGLNTITLYLGLTPSLQLIAQWSSIYFLQTWNISISTFKKEKYFFFTTIANFWELNDSRFLISFEPIPDFCSTTTVLPWLCDEATWTRVAEMSLELISSVITGESNN